MGHNMSRNSNRDLKTIKTSEQHELLKDRDVKSIRIYSDTGLLYPPDSARRKFEYTEHYWASGDRFYKLSYKYYGNRDDWWVIARFNGKPTEADLTIGEKILIPFPIEFVKPYMGYYSEY